MQSVGPSTRAPRGGRVAGTPIAPPAAPQPGWFAPAGEKELHRALMMTGGPRPEDLARIAHSHPEYSLLASALEGFLQLQEGSRERARELLAWAFDQRQEIARHPFAKSYLAGATVRVQVSPGVSADLPMSTSTIGLALAELHQEAGDLEAARSTVSRIHPPTTMSALSLAELYLEAGQHAEVRVLAEDSDAPGLEQALARLPG